MIHPYDVLVIGGGISGMMASVAAAQTGIDVLLLDGADHIGKKYPAVDDGSGCFTNEEVRAEHFYDADPDFVRPVLEQFSGSDLTDWMMRAGLDTKNEGGRICPVSGQAQDVLDILRLQMNRCFVRVELYQKVVEIKKTEDDLFEVQCVKNTYYGRKVVLAAGSKAAAQTDMGEGGYRLAESLGMEVKKPLPALTGLRLAAPFASEWDGLNCDGSVSLTVDGTETACAAGKLNLTAGALLGVPAFDVSRYASRALDEGKEVTARLSFLPGMNEQEAYELLSARVERVGDYLARDFLIGLIPKKLARILIGLAGIRHSRPIHYLKEEEIRRLSGVMTSLTSQVSGHGNFRQAATCTGGVLTSGVKAGTLESLKVPGLYLAGEILDVDGMYAGYNLHWAFSSGYAAGKAAAGN